MFTLGFESCDALVTPGLVPCVVYLLTPCMLVVSRELQTPTVAGYWQFEFWRKPGVSTRYTFPKAQPHLVDFFLQNLNLDLLEGLAEWICQGECCRGRI